MYFPAQFAGKTVLITGAAGDIGNATARAFARKGASLVLADLPSCQDVLMEKRESLQDLGAESVHLVSVDMRESEQVEAMVFEAVQKAGHIDCFFNNAGVQGELLPLYEQSEEAFKQTLHVNILGVFLGMKYVAMAMREHGQGGTIINTASLAGLQGPPNMAAYGASKFAVVGLTKTASKDLAPDNIRVCAVAPGLLEGKMWDSQIKGQAECAKRRLGKLAHNLSWNFTYFTQGMKLLLFHKFSTLQFCFGLEKTTYFINCNFNIIITVIRREMKLR